MNARRLERSPSSSSEDDYYAEVLAACAELVALKKAYDAAVDAQTDAAERREAAKERRDLALWRLSTQEHEPVRPLSARLRKSLERRRFTQEEIRWCGLSYGNVRLILARPLDRRPAAGS